MLTIPKIKCNHVEISSSKFHSVLQPLNNKLHDQNYILNIKFCPIYWKSNWWIQIHAPHPAPVGENLCCLPHLDRWHYVYLFSKIGIPKYSIFAEPVRFLYIDFQKWKPVLESMGFLSKFFDKNRIILLEDHGYF